MFLNFFELLRQEGLPVSLKDHLVLLEALDKGLGQSGIDEFYVLARAIYIKDEKNLDGFDRVFAHYFRGAELAARQQDFNIPEEWLRKLMERELTDEEKALIEALGGPEALRERFKQLLEEQHERHQGGNKWIGTGGTSPFGAYGYNPEGYRIGQQGSRNRRAVKVWDRREYKNLDDQQAVDIRNLKMALRTLRVFTREGVPDELHIPGTIDRTCRNGGLLDLDMRPERKNRVKVLMLMDIGGSMDDHINQCRDLFKAAKHEFKHLHFYYFHNCVYEYVWKDNNRRHDERISTWELLNKYNKDYKLIFVGDAAMSPYEILSVGGSVEHHNPEAGMVWMERLLQQFPGAAWLNPNAREGWSFFESATILYKLMNGRMYPLTLAGLADAMKQLKKRGRSTEPMPPI